ncbi:hypothetical protein [Yersinia ruckeri]|nr:hypothetical protein [Yersinia ruckeri]
MSETFEQLVIKRHGNRYNLQKDRDGYYANQTVKRMYEFWCLAKGVIQ